MAAQLADIQSSGQQSITQSVHLMADALQGIGLLGPEFAADTAFVQSGDGLHGPKLLQVEGQPYFPLWCLLSLAIVWRLAVALNAHLYLAELLAVVQRDFQLPDRLRAAVGKGLGLSET